MIVLGNTMKRGIAATALCLCVLLAGCASTRIESSGQPMKTPLCGSDDQKIAVAVLWAPWWRPDQKEPLRREAAALRGIRQFFSTQSCLKETAIRRISLPAGRERLSDAELLDMARGAASEFDRVVLIVVRELGPKLHIGIPVLVEGGTEVVLEVRVVDRVTATSLANVQTHWQRGGPFHLKGVGTLDQDMQTTLSEVFSPSTRDR